MSKRALLALLLGALLASCAFADSETDALGDDIPDDDDDAAGGADDMGGMGGGMPGMPGGMGMGDYGDDCEFTPQRNRTHASTQARTRRSRIVHTRGTGGSCASTT